MQTLKSRIEKQMNSMSTLYIDHPIPVRHGHLGRSIQQDQSIIEYFDKLKLESPEIREDSNLSGWKTGWDAHIDHEEVLGDLMDDIIRWHNHYISHPRNDHIPEPFKDAEMYELDAEVWYTEYQPGNVADEHTHGTVSRTSFVYYLHTDDESSPLTFVQKGMAQYSTFPTTQAEIHLPTYSGMIVFFPSFMYHKVRPTKTVRNVLAGNINDILYRTN